MSLLAPTSIVRTRVRITGLVQGVGFRPFVWREATARGLAGWVGNDAAGVVLEVEGSDASVAGLLDALRRPPVLARVDDVTLERLDPLGSKGFEVRSSGREGARTAQVSPETTTCEDCLRELHDPVDRRFGYPFLNCTSCGPRYTIVLDVPYDRARTTMAAFAMCEVCQAEYDDPADRRFHAEPTCCPQCGPQLELVGAPGDPLAGALQVLRDGGVLAVKGLGGFHLAVDACREDAVALLRRRKHREERPFALMVPDLAAAEALCVVGPRERELLTSRARPIVLLHRHGSVAPSVAPGSPDLGLMLPYTPLHALLLEAFDGPLVLTSGNLSDEPIAFLEGDARLRLAGLADAFLTHDRAIRTRVDDSVVKVVRGRTVPLRRSRGYVPDPVRLPLDCPRPVLACGPALKSTFALTRGAHCFVSHHVGDLDDYATYTSYVDGITHLSSLLDVRPEVAAHDLHPDYPSTRYAQESGLELMGVQHHHAHIASCLADNGRQDRVIGVAFDGLGMGTDGTAWGGEFLLADLRGFDRVGHLEPVPMPGGDRATREPWRMALSYLEVAFGADLPSGLHVVTRQPNWKQVLSAVRAGVNAPATSSAGRLFDAVAALLGVRDVVTYEGQAAVELERAADPDELADYEVPVVDGVVRTTALLRALVEDLQRGTSTPVLAARFHNSLAAVVLLTCERLRAQGGLSTVALSGGVFQNGLLLSRCLDLLEASGFEVLTHHQVPPNDGGISLGQAAVVAARLRTGS